jgi:type I restriction enzyme M protein
MFALTLPAVKMQLRNLVFIQSTLGTLGNRLLELEVPILHGAGPWCDRVISFRELLKKRDESLALLRKMASSEAEL